MRDGAVVKGVKFEGLRNAGDPAELAARYNVEGIDEVVILDVTATLESRRALARTISDVARAAVHSAGGGRRHSHRGRCGGGRRRGRRQSEPEYRGAASIRDLITRLAVALRQPGRHRRHRCEAPGRRVRRLLAQRQHGRAREAVEWAQEAADRGAGEILLTSIDKDGTRSGFDCELTAAVSSAVPIPVIASGGAGKFDHFVDVFTRGRADAALAASIFHFSEHGVSALKQHLAAAGIPVRMTNDE